MRFSFLLFLCLSQHVFAAEWTTRALAEVGIFPHFRAPAGVVARDEASLSAEVSARIVDMPVRAGEVVKRGAVLVRLDDAGYRIDVARAQAQLKLVDNRIRLAEAQFAQSRALAAKGFISDDGLRIRETELAVLRSEADATRATLDAARLGLSRTVIRAPYDGVLRTRLANVGDLAAPGTALVVFASAAEAEVRARVPQQQIDDLKAAAAWSLKAGDTSYRVQLRRISPLLDRAGQAREVIFAAEDELPPGLAGELQWQSSTLHLPPAYLQQVDGTLGVFVEREGKAAFLPVPGAQVGRAAAVGLAPGTRVIDQGRFALSLNKGAP